MPWSEFTALLLLIAALSFTPGPNTALSTVLGANLGLRRALPFCLGVPVGWSLIYALSAGGVAALLLALPLLRAVVLLAGMASLLWLAWQLAGAGQMSQANASQMRAGFWQGVGLQFVNIKAWMIAVSIVAGWVAGRDDALVRFALVLPVMWLFAFGSNLSYAAMGSLLRGWLARGRRLLWFNRTMAAVLAATALWMVWREWGST
jgi:threonine/homoserine/homoserine lactone efflux protein